MSQLNLTPETTVHNFAEWYRTDNNNQQSPANFAKDLMKMEQIAQLPPDSDPKEIYNAVLSVVEQIDDPQIFGLGVCWLDRKGYGEMSMQQVLRLRGGNPPA